jgi:hypothetical protein
MTAPVEIRFIDIGETEAFLRTADAIKAKCPEVADDVAAMVALAMPIASDMVVAQPHDSHEVTHGVTQCRRCGELGHRAADLKEVCRKA